ncbi:thioredoxin-dependent thiol peroxidase [Thermoleophilum album]|uniref:thioredoxin-dependent thiol peroxidase n=1 Tax=Thermoleophilum album TaxID=29539 RepID=UPI00237CE349|nr:thioredoxin-dependent thiol peroxidase [Thermoleophilum album]WDT93841.1 thioredoxin-dependent thiol peroxidase [Thermoleophilum album]
MSQRKEQATEPAGDTGRAPAVGDPAPDFELRDQNDRPVRLSDFRGKRVVLYFYPRAHTPGCTTQACGIRDHYDRYRQLGVEVLGVSPDTPKRLASFAAKHSLPFTLLADPDHVAAEAYGVWVEKRMYGRAVHGVERSTFVIAPDGRIERVFRRVRPADHDRLLLEHLGAG